MVIATGLVKATDFPLTMQFAFFAFAVVRLLGVCAGSRFFNYAMLSCTFGFHAISFQVREVNYGYSITKKPVEGKVSVTTNRYYLQASG
jgi:hypothetical protein